MTEARTTECEFLEFQIQKMQSRDAVARCVVERDRFRALLQEFADHRADSSLAWFDDWTRRVHKEVDGEAA
jgi:hypothetical protein